MSKRDEPENKLPKKNVPLASAEPAQEAGGAMDKTQLHMPASIGDTQKVHVSRMPEPTVSKKKKASGKKKSSHDERPHSIFRPRTKNPNFLLSVAVSTINLSIILILCICLALGGALVGIAKAYVDTAPTLNLAALDAQDKTSFIYDSKGNLITDYKGTEDRVMVSIDEIPQMLQNAFIAVEDARFYEHNGVDVKRIVGALVTNLTTGSSQGGSTITQQLIKMTVLSSEQSYKRKLQEAYLAMELETRYTKDQILESYLNTIFLGGSYYGVKVAAYGYFGKELSELTLRECAMLAGMTRSPNYYNPRRNFYTRNTEGSKTADITNNRTNYVLRQMRENGMISTQEYQAALDTSTAYVLETSPASTDMYAYPHYVEYAISDVVDTFLELGGLEDTSANRYAMENKLRTGGYSVYLCLDTEIQELVEETLASWDDYPRLRDPSDKVYQARNSDGTYTEIEQPQAAACVYDYRTGELKAIVGGRYKPTARKTLNRASDMNMPVGSSIKPLTVYAPAIDLGASPASIAYNMPVPIPGWKDSAGKDAWPQNYGGGGYKGPQSFRNALINSHNTSAAQILMSYVGVSRSVEYLRLMGVSDSNINPDPFGLALGSSGITPVQMAVAFGTIANKGVYQQPLSFSRILDSNGNLVVDMHQQQDRHQVFKPSTAYLVVDMLKGAVQSGTGTKAKISSQVVAGKTGTNSDSKGVFFAGMTGWYSGSVWIGHDNYKALSSKATGGNAAAPLWQEFMERIHKAKGLDSREIIDGTPADYGLVRVTTCGVSGQLATDACYNDVSGYKTITDYWYEGSVPTSYCSMHKQVSVCTDSGLLATEYCPGDVVDNRGIVLIPRGHPLYNAIGSYGSTIRKYLGEFATLQSQDDIANHICQLHDEFTSSQAPSELEALVTDAYNLTYTAYQLVGSSPYISNDTRRQINIAITTVQTLLSISPIDYTSLEGATHNLRSQLQAAGLL
ncbi:MAG: PBP1A family penicillin-binding protein [Clostridia bacterium]|nr:PBP1A family penicillin-binding protein [Clostridia bacterium]MBQ7052301.1 PBP1A family penicillin-binding protein [Clostridia bacterium]